MKTLILILFAVSLNAQSLLLFGDKFNPNFDGNALAWYDGDVGLSTSQWNDQGTGGHDIVFTNSPTIVSDATPKRDAVRFNGIDESGTVATPTTTQPFTIYIVLNQLTWTNNDRIFGDGTVTNRKYLAQRNILLNMSMYSGVFLESDPDLALNTWGVITTTFNGVSSEFRTNLGTAVTGDVGALNGAGITLASSFINTLYSNVEIGYLIIRTGADNTTTQNKIINGLKKECGLSF